MHFQCCGILWLFRVTMLLTFCLLLLTDVCPALYVTTICVLVWRKANSYSVELQLFFFYCTPEPWVPYRVLFVLCFCGGGVAAAGLLSFTLRPIYLVFSFVCKWNVLLLEKGKFRLNQRQINSIPTGPECSIMCEGFFLLTKEQKYVQVNFFSLCVCRNASTKSLSALWLCRGRAAGAAGWESPWPTQSSTLKPSFRPEWLESLMQSLGLWPFKST